MAALFSLQLHYGARTVIGFLLMDYKSLYQQYSDELLDYYKRGLIKVKCQLEGDLPFSGLEGVSQAIEVTKNNLTNNLTA